MKKLLLSFAVMLVGLTAMAQSTLIYSMEPVAGKNTDYSGSGIMKCNGIEWKIEGNTNYSYDGKQLYRIGGKKLTDQDRACTSLTPMIGSVDKVVLKTYRINLTVNSATLYVSDNADFDNAEEYVVGEVKADDETVFEVNASVGAYYRLVFNVTTSGSSNQYVEVERIDFYGTLPEGTVDSPVFSLEGGSYVGTQTVELSAGEDCKIYYTLDGSEPTEESAEYTEPISLAETTTIKAIAVLDGKASMVVSQTYTILKIMTLSEALEAATKTDTGIAMDTEGLICTGVRGTSNVYFTDGTGKGILVYSNGHGFNVGDKLSGVVVTTLTLYNGAAELKNLKANTEGLTVTPGQETPVLEKNISDLSAASQGAVVALKSVTYKGGKFYQGEDVITPYNAFMTLPELEEDAVYSITGVVTYFNQLQICPRSEADIVKEVADGIDAVIAADVQTDGKFIANGRIVIVKAGKKYEASGLLVR
ncbi:MAG: chitobiase/beta-hexosaminidase C-terminal domain-containing protein [Bacteroidaceae bacterium]|nr:chitobiase/beta-hexosaminidase C-terminal domain-containing protein [Bacteroidaceae bacterium]